jgi:hypothetical protein
MQKKYKRAIIITSVLLVLLALGLILGGLRQVSLDEYGLNYNTVMANYSSASVYGPGLYLIGVSNQFIRINKNQQTMAYKNLTTFTTDFYILTAYLEVSYLFNFSTANQFSTLTAFYESFGDDPAAILEPIVKNQILITLSS